MVEVGVLVNSCDNSGVMVDVAPAGSAEAQASVGLPAEGPAEQHADWCSGECPRWLGINAPSCLGYPCRCAATQADAPGWSDGKCWWTKHDKIRSRCPCWGGKRDGRPGDCCAHHSANPAAAPDPEALPAGQRESGGEGETLDDSAPFEVPTEPAGWHAPHDREPLWLDSDGDDGEPWGPYPARARKPFERRWPAEELTCVCVLACAKDKRAATVHCVQCCNDFANPQTFSVHRRQWTQPCRDPWQVRDCDTGRPLLYQDSAGIWRDSYPTADDAVAPAA